MYCIRKPPKTEESRSELTHHQRAHAKLNRWDMFGDDSKIAKHSIELSFDDKAYVRPGTEGTVYFINNSTSFKYTSVKV